MDAPPALVASQGALRGHENLDPKWKVVEVHYFAQAMAHCNIHAVSERAAKNRQNDFDVSYIHWPSELDQDHSVSLVPCITVYPKNRVPGYQVAFRPGSTCAARLLQTG